MPRAVATNQQNRHNALQLHAHHSRPYRKRHLVGLSVSLLCLCLMLGVVVSVLTDEYNRRINAAITVHEETPVSDAADQLVRLQSSGFGFRMIPNRYSVSLSDSEAKKQDDVIVKTDLYGAYTQLTFKPVDTLGVARDNAMLEVSMLPDTTVSSDTWVARKAELMREYQRQAESSSDLRASIEETIGGVSFTKFMVRSTSSKLSTGDWRSGTARQDIYIGRLPNGHPLVIRVRYAESDVVTASGFQTLIHGLYTSPMQQRLEKQLSYNAPGKALSMFAGVFGLTQGASAQSSIVIDDASALVAKTSPSVVKLYHITCGAILFQGQTLTADTCGGSTGSGFIVSEDGYVATNGHVVASDPKSVVLERTDIVMLARLLSIDGYGQREIQSIIADFQSSQTARAAVADAIARLPTNAFAYANKKEFYIVAMSQNAPDIDSIITQRALRETHDIKSAKLVAIDYNPSDLYSATGFSHSDVALLKITGHNYPVAHLGSIGSTVAGAPITVIGYPSDAENNGLIKSDILQTTATTGIVSAIRDVKGSNRKVLQSDVNIGHGNSGGPGFDVKGNVLGIATYILGSGDGSASISYLRDIQDFKNLLTAHNIVLNTDSKTQQVWESGLDDFYAAHYTAALRKFEIVAAAYPNHTTVERYRGIARSKIASGEEAPTLLAKALPALGLAASVCGAVIAIMFILRHRMHHKLYWTLQNGSVQGPLGHFMYALHPHPAVVVADDIKNHSHRRNP